MTVKQNVAYPLRHRRVPRAEIERKTGGRAGAVGCRSFAERSVVSFGRTDAAAWRWLRSLV